MKTNLLTIAIALFLPLAACESDPGGTDPTDTGTDTDVPTDTDEYGSLSVDTSPDGAVLTLNEEVKGTTPIVVENLAPGQYHVVISLDGYEDYTDTVTVSADSVLPLDITLNPDTPTYDLSGRWMHDGYTGVCDVTHTGNQVQGFCGMPSNPLTLNGTEFEYGPDSMDNVVTGSILDNDHVHLNLTTPWGSDDFYYTRL